MLAKETSSKQTESIGVKRAEWQWGNGLYAIHKHKITNSLKTKWMENSRDKNRIAKMNNE